MSPAPPVTARGQRTREGVLGGAREVFEQRGFNATRMNDIADAFLSPDRFASTNQ